MDLGLYLSVALLVYCPIGLLPYWSIGLLAWWSVVRSHTPTRDAGGHGVCHVLYRDAVYP